MNATEQFTKAMTDLRTLVSRLVRNNENLAEQLRRRKQLVITDSEAANLLRDALAAKVGWREEARALLGLNEPIACDKCGSFFQSGGKRKKFCGDC